MRGLPPVLLLAGALLLGVAPATAAPQSWNVKEGTVTLSYDAAHVADLGLRVVDARETAARPVDDDLVTATTAHSFALTGGQDLVFLTDGGAFRGFVGSPRISFDGGIAFAASHPRSGEALAPLYLFDFALELRLDEEIEAISVRSSDPSLPVPLEVRNPGARFWWQRGDLALAMGDLVVSKAWAERLGQPELAGRWVGGFDVRFRATPATGEAIAPEPAPPAERGGTLDVTLGELYGINDVGHIGSYPTGTTGLSAATTSCNTGNVNVPWNGPMQETHPFIGLALFRLDSDGVLEMIGKNWMKHGFFALSDDDCNLGCPNGSNGTYLAVDCSDTYSVFNNASQFYLGPRHEIDPYTAVWEACGSFFDEPGAPDADCSRDYNGNEPNAVNHTLEVYDGDLGNAGATYYYEGIYVVADDTKLFNNIGWRECTMSWTGSSWNFNDVGASLTPTLGPVVGTWGDLTKQGDVPDDGDFVMSVDVTDLGGGMWHYEYAVYNRNSNRGSHSISIPIGAANLSNVGFHDVDQDAGNDWTPVQSAGMITWSTDDWATDPDANAIHYQSMYNFRFDADQAPQSASAILEIFEPGTGTSFAIATQAPSGGVTDAPIGPVASELALSRGEPNPFSESTTLRFSLKQAGPVRLSVLDVTGRTVRVLLEGTAEAGPGRVRWDGRDRSGSHVASGVYFFRLDSAGETRTVKGTFLR